MLMKSHRQSVDPRTRSIEEPLQSGAAAGAAPGRGHRGDAGDALARHPGLGLVKARRRWRLSASRARRATGARSRRPRRRARSTNTCGGFEQVEQLVVLRTDPGRRSRWRLRSTGRAAGRRRDHRRRRHDPRHLPVGVARLDLRRPVATEASRGRPVQMAGVGSDCRLPDVSSSRAPSRSQEHT